MIPICSVSDIIERERNGGTIPEVIKQAIGALEISEIRALITDKKFDAKWGIPLTLAIFDYDEKNIVGFALLVLNDSGKFVPEGARNSVGIIGWMSVENGRCGKLSRDHCGSHCTVDVFWGILEFIKSNMKGTFEYCWSFFDDLILGFGGYRTTNKAPNGETIAVVKL